MKRLLLATLSLLLVASSSADYRMIVRLKAGQTTLDAQRAASALGGTMVERTPNAPFALFSLPNDPLSIAVQQMEIATGVVDVLWTGDNATLRSAESVSRGNTLSVIGTQNDLVAKNDNFLDQVNWNTNLANTNGRTVKVAILDSGLARRQSYLWSKVVASMDAFGGNVDDVPTSLDSNGDGILDEGVGHGTMVAGLVNVVAPRVSLVIAKVADSDGQATAWNIVKGVAFAVAQGCEVANVSLGSEEPVPAFNGVATWARSQGLLIVAAIGNASENHAWYPSRDSGTLCVAGIDVDDTKAWFSNWDSVAVSAAPSVGLVSQFWDGGLAKWSGTSFAAPFVTAAIADCLRRTTTRTPDFLTQAVTLSGRSVDAINPNYVGKIGRILDIGALNSRINMPLP